MDLLGGNPRDVLPWMHWALCDMTSELQSQSYDRYLRGLDPAPPTAEPPKPGQTSGQTKGKVRAQADGAPAHWASMAERKADPRLAELRQRRASQQQD